MLRAIQVLGLVWLVIGCTEVEPRADAGAASAPRAAIATQLGSQAHHGIAMTPAIRACRDACWADIPFNACLQQRDACLAQAKTSADTHHCRHMSHTCRKTRRKCLQGCWTGGPPREELPESGVAEDPDSTDE